MTFSIANYAVEVEGMTELLMQNGSVGPDPLHPVVKLKKKFTGKRKKTDDDLATITQLEWYTGLYLDDIHRVAVEDTVDKQEIITFVGGKVTQLPARLFKASMVNAGKNYRLGSTLKSALRISYNNTADCAFTFNGSPDPNELVNNSKFVDIRAVVVNRARVMKARPKFNKWNCKFNISFFTDKLDLAQVKDCLTIAGEAIGIGDYRPEKGGDYGTFRIIKMEEM
jgi:hypothetical protein